MASEKEKIRLYDIILQKHIDKKDVVKIKRIFKEREENINGIILKKTKEFLLIQINYDFILDGYAIIRKDQFDALRCNKFDRTSKKILKAEGVLDKNYGLNKNIRIDNWKNIFTDLKKLDYHVIIECEDKDEPDFIIGPLKKVAKTSVGIQYYDPTGKLEPKLTIIKYNEITIVRFEDRYSQTFRKYLIT